MSCEQPEYLQFPVQKRSRGVALEAVSGRWAWMVVSSREASSDPLWRLMVVAVLCLFKQTCDGTMQDHHWEQRQRFRSTRSMQDDTMLVLELAARFGSSRHKSEYAPTLLSPVLHLHNEAEMNLQICALELRHTSCVAAAGTTHCGCRCCRNGTMMQTDSRKYIGRSLRKLTASSD